MDKVYNPHVKFILTVIYIGLVYYFVTLLLPKIFTWFAPFILAFAVVAATRPLAAYFVKRLKFTQKSASITALFVFLIIAGSIIGYIITRIIVELINLALNYETYISYIQNYSMNAASWFESFKGHLSPDTAAFFDGIVPGFAASVATEIGKLENLTSFAISVPNTLIFLIVFIASSVFIALDYDKIKKSLILQVPAKWRRKVSQVKGYALSALSKYLKGMCVVMAIVYVVCLVGLFIMRVKYVFLSALFLALIDILPIIGTGTILIPWCIIAFFMKNYVTGFSALALYVAITLTRQVAEPRIIGKAMDLHPLVVWISIYAGYKIFGLVGIIVSPIVVVVLVNMQQAGVIRFWNTEPEPKK